MQKPAISTGITNKPEPVFTGKTEHCIKCNTDKRVMRITDESKSIGYSHYVEPCECDLRYRQNIEQDAKQQKLDEVTNTIINSFQLSTTIKDFDTYTFDNFKPRKGSIETLEEAKNFANNFIEFKNVGMGLMIGGQYGNGKSHLLKAITNELKYNHSCIYIEYSDFFKKVFKTYESQTEKEEDILKAYNECELLVIDDIGVGNWSPAKEEILKSVMDYRESASLPIVLALNPEAEDNLSPRILSRLNGVCKMVLNKATDYRPEVKQQRLKLLTNTYKQSS